MSRSAVGTYPWQDDRYHELMFDLGHEREFVVRDFARVAIENPRTFSSGMYIAYQRPRPMFVSERESIRPVPSTTLELRLINRLERYPQVAQLVAEEILRDQIARLS